MTELHLLCREYRYNGSKSLGRWRPVGKVILRIRVDTDEWENNRDSAYEKINASLIPIWELGLKYELIKIFRLPHQTISYQHVYDAVNNNIDKNKEE